MYIYLATIAVFLISNQLYLTTLYVKVNDPNELYMILLLFYFVVDGRCYSLIIFYSFDQMQRL